MSNQSQSEEMKALIKSIIGETIASLKISGLMNNNRVSTIEKTEYILKNYPALKAGYSENGISRKYIEVLENALKAISDDEYFQIIPMRYFENQSREKVAEYFDVTPPTITRHQRELLERLSVLIFADDVIYELFL